MMLDAHMDEIGIMVSYVEEKGFLRFAPIGGWDPRVLPAQQVEIRARNGKKHRGVMGASPPHIQTSEEQKQALKVEDLFIDIGAKSREDVTAWSIGAGSPGTLDYPFQPLGMNRAMGKALDDRAGCAVLIRCLYFSRIGPILPSSLTLLSAEVGSWSKTATTQIKPMLPLRLRTVGADTGDPAHRCPARLGQGPAICR
jgi:endoglucanase